MIPRRALPSLAPSAAAPLRRSHFLYLVLLVIFASVVGSWLASALGALARGAPPPDAAAAGPLRTAGTAAAAAAAAPGTPADASHLQRLEGTVAALERQVAQLVGALDAHAAAAPPPPAAAAAAAAAAPPPPPLPGAAPRRRPRPTVLGMAKGIDAVGVYRFVRSLRTHTPDARIVVFTDQASLDAHALLPWLYEAFGVTLQLFDVAALPARVQGYHPSSYRWILMRDYLRGAAAAGGGGGHVFFSDVRDTVFQDDLFARLEAAEGGGAGFFAFQEQRPGTIAACGWNSGWVKDCFGDAGLAQVGHNVVSCSGTSAASWDDAVAYAELMGARARADSFTRAHSI